MPKVEALKSFPFDGRQRKKGDQFLAKQKHARVLEVGKLAKVIEDDKPAAQTYATRDMQAASPRGTNWHSFTVPELKAQADKRKIAYPPRVTKGSLIKLLKG